jgi:hypothetical protein
MLDVTSKARAHAVRRGSRFLAVFAGLLLAAVPAFLSVAAAAEVVGGKERQEATAKLFDAVYANDMARVQTSLAAGADLAVRDRWGATPIDVAVDRGYFEIAHFLLSVRDLQGDDPAREATAEPGAAPAAAEPKPPQPPKRKPRPAAERRPTSAPKAASAAAASAFSLPPSLVGAAKPAPAEAGAAAPPPGKPSNPPKAAAFSMPPSLVGAAKPAPAEAGAAVAAASPPGKPSNPSKAAASRLRPDKTKSATATVARRSASPPAAVTPAAGAAPAMPPPPPLPAGQANPFDPTRVAPGADLAVPGSAEETTSTAVR